MAEVKTIIADPGSSIFSAPKRTTSCLVKYSRKNLDKRTVLDKKEIIIARSPTVELVVNEQSVSRSFPQFLSASNLGTAATYIHLYLREIA